MLGSSHLFEAEHDVGDQVKGFIRKSVRSCWLFMSIFLGWGLNNHSLSRCSKLVSRSLDSVRYHVGLDNIAYRTR